jgi:hypothetical protein
VPIDSLINHLVAGVTLVEFLYDFPSVARLQAIELPEVANKILTAKNMEQLYAAAT